MKYGSEPMSAKELEDFAKEEFWEFANQANAKHSYGAEIEYGVGTTADTKGKSKHSNYYRVVQINFDNGQDLFGNPRIEYFMYYWLDKEGFTEHGGSVPGWLDEKGYQLMEIMELIDFENEEIQ